MRRKVMALLTAVAVALGIGLVTATPAQAAVPTGCTTGWSGWYGTSWGRFQWCYAFGSAPEDPGQHYMFTFQVQDILTDGYAVHLEACADHAWNGNGSIHTPYSCHDAPVYPQCQLCGAYDPLYGLVLIDRWDGTGQDTCVQSTGAVATSQFWPSEVNANQYWDPAHSYMEISLVKGRCEGGAYQAVARWNMVLVAAGSGGGV